MDEESRYVASPEFEGINKFFFGPKKYQAKYKIIAKIVIVLNGEKKNIIYDYY